MTSSPKPGLWIESLNLSHFRSHKSAKLNLDGRPVVLFGANGAGKTNILEAVSLLSPGRGMRRAGLDEIARQPEALGWKIDAGIQSKGQFYEATTKAEVGSSRTVKLDGKSVTQIALGRVARIVWLVPQMDRLWIEGADGRRRFLDRIAMSFEPSHAEASVKFEKAMRERNRLLKDMVRDAHWYVALENQMSEAAREINRNRDVVVQRLNEAQQEASDAFPKALLSVDPGAANYDNLAEALSENRPRDMAAGRTLIGPHRADLRAFFEKKGVDAKHASTGEQKAILLSLILANGRALSADFGTAPIMLLDEVSAHLDPARRAALYDEICALGAQAWMTGTEADLFQEFGTRAQHFNVSEQSGLSVLSSLN